MAITETPATQLIINQLTREQYNNLETIANNELYIIDENILSSANAYFKNPVAPEQFQISAYADAAVVNKAYVTTVVSNIREVINTKQDKLTDSNEGAYIDITADADSSKTTIAVKNVVSAGTDISAEGTQSYLTTSKAVKEYVEATVATTAPISHKHEISDVNGLSDALAAKQDKLTAESDSHITITTDNKISVSDITNDSDEIVANDTGLTTGKAVHDYVAAQIGTVDQDFIKSVEGDYEAGISAKVSVEATTTDKAVKLTIHTEDIASAQALAEHTGNGDIHVTADQKADWTSTSAIVAANKATWDKADTALQEISSATTDYITIVNKDTVSAIITTDKLDEIDSNTKGIVPPSVIAALNAKVNELQQIPQFTVVVAYSINLDAKTYKLTEGGDDNDCVQNTVYLVPDSKAAAGAHIEYLCYGESKIIEQIGTTEIDLSDYAKTTAISGGFDEHGVKVDLTDGKLTGGVTPGSIEKDNDSVVTGGAVFEKLEEKQDNLTAGSYITITDDDTISVSAVATSSDNIANSDTGLTTGKAVHDYVANELTAKQDNLTDENAGDYIAITEATATASAKISVTNITDVGTDITLNDDGLTTGKAVREALNSMIVFKKYN